jgi:flavin-dependent dehydrogenase
MATQCDVLVIGGGPGGSTAGALLAERGYRVVIVEKNRHPRFHIGESLLPANLPLFERLGVGEAVRAIGMMKWGAEFVSPWHEKARQEFQFAEAWNKDMPYAYQVRRADFDTILFRNAEAKGAMTREGCRVQDVALLEEGAGARVSARHEDGSVEDFEARFVIDASGRDTFLGNRFHMKRRNPRHNSSALYGHFRGAARNDGRAEGNISIFWFEHGWFWFIPLADGTTSVGAVVWPYYLKQRSKPVEAFFRDTVALCPALAARLAGAELVSEVSATGNFSYGCDRSYGANYVLLGDAFSFIDPVFSSGVMLAMHGGFLAADAVDACLSKPSAARRALRVYDHKLRQGPRAFSWFIYRVNHPTMRDLFMGPRNIFRVQEALLSVLAGDIFGDTPIWRSLALFKGLYYLNSLYHFRRSMQTFRKRRERRRSEEAPLMTGSE